MAVHKKYPALGRGLDALISTKEVHTDGSSTINEIELDKISPNPNQPRRDFDPESLRELADSIAEIGIVQPITLRKMEDDTFQIIAGERRWRASKLAGLREIPCLIKDFDDQKVSELALVENLQRDDLNPVEEAEGYRYLLETFSLTQDEIAKKVGKSRSAVANSLRLNNLCDDVKELLRDNKLTQGHARALLTLDKGLQIEYAEKIISEDLNVRQAEALAQKSQVKKNASKPKSINPMTQKYYKDLEGSLSSRFGTKVKISEGSKKGKIEIEYYSKDDLERILFELKR